MIPFDGLAADFGSRRGENGKGEVVVENSSSPRLVVSPDAFWGLLAALLLAIITFLDLITPRGLVFSLFYLFPIAMIAYRFPLPWSALSVILTSGVWFVASIVSGRKFESELIVIWTIAARLINYGLFALVIHRLHAMLLISREQVGLLARANEEKARLLKELNHRVKNSLATVVGLIHFEEGLVGDPRLIGSLDRLQNRVRSMAELYDQLFHSSDSDSVDLAAYLQKIAGYVGDSHAVAERGIRVETRLESVLIDSKRAISIGLVVNELLTDAFKYAFPDGRGGRVELGLRVADGRIFLEVGDDGIGLPQGFDPARSKGFGFRLVAGVTKDLSAKLTFGSGPGARFVIDLPFAAADSGAS